MRALELCKLAIDVTHMITSRQPEVVSRCERLDSGWQVHVEVVDSKGRLADNDIMATYRLEFDTLGELMKHERIRRYSRGNTGVFAA